jgi:hypothetical protein
MPRVSRFMSAVAAVGRDNSRALAAFEIVVIGFVWRNS